MSAKFDRDIINGVNIDVALSATFDEFGRWDSAEVADECCRLFSLITGLDRPEEDSPIYLLFYYGCLAAACGQNDATAHALGVDAEALLIATEAWSGFQDNCPDAIDPSDVSGIDDLLILMDQQNKIP